MNTQAKLLRQGGHVAIHALRKRPRAVAAVIQTSRTFTNIGLNQGRNQHALLFHQSPFYSISSQSHAFSTLSPITINAAAPHPFDFHTLAEMQTEACKAYADRPFLGFKASKGTPYQWLSYQQFGQMVDKSRALLQEAGIGPGDKVAIISKNRVEWAIAAYGAFSRGATWVPMYEQQQLKDWEYILKDSGAKLLIVSTESIYDKTRHFAETIPSLKDVWCLDVDVPARLDAVTPAMIASSPPAPIQPDDVATLIYTSGTTGVPKGVQLTHANLCSDIKGMNDVVPLDSMKEARSLSFLPWAHCIGKNCELHNMMQRGAQVALAQDISTLADNMREIKPTILFSVPTLYKKVYDRVQETVTAQGYFSRWLVDTALGVAQERRLVMAGNQTPSALLSLKYNIFDKMVLKKLREPLGGQLRISPVGGSAMNAAVTEFFENLGVAIMEGYGLTETSPLLTINALELQKRKIGTVGNPIRGAELAIVRDGVRVTEGEEGEIWAAGPMIFKGYHNKPEETLEAFGILEGKRYFRTGDLGVFQANLLKITGRVKELYKLENGKYVAPAVVEKALLESEYIFQALLHGANKPFNVALIVPNWTKLGAWAVAKQIPGLSISPSPDELKASPEVQAFMTENIVLACKDRVKKYEMPQAWILFNDPFTLENEMLTPKMSVKRHVVVKTYAQQIEKVYTEAELAAARKRSRIKDGKASQNVEEATRPIPL